MKSDCRGTQVRSGAFDIGTPGNCQRGERRGSGIHRKGKTGKDNSISSQRNSQWENTILMERWDMGSSLQSQTRTMRLAIQARIKSKIMTGRPFIPWLVHHSALLIDICRVCSDGHAPYERRKGNQILRPLPQLRECTRHLRPHSVAKTKLDNLTLSGRVGCWQVFGRNQEGYTYSLRREHSRRTASTGGPGGSDGIRRSLQL